MNNLVLIIEDSSEIRENTAELLELAGYRTAIAINGKEGLEQARKFQPDLILCDIMMPELDGYGVLRALGNIPGLKNTPFVFVTAKSEKTDFRNGMDLGADDYLTKPFSGDELLRIVAARIKKENDRKASRENHPETPGAFSEKVHLLEEIAKLSINRTIKKIKAKASVYIEGDSATHLCFVNTGKIKTYKTNEWGKEYITEIINAGEFFGHTALFNDHVHRHSASALENSEISFIPKQDFLNLLYSDKELAMKFLKFFSGNMSECEEKQLHFAYNSARKKVADALLFIYQQYQEEEENTEFSFPANRENISAIAGIAPESVSRNLSDFRDEKLIVTDNGSIRIVNFKKLAQMHS